MSVATSETMWEDKTAKSAVKKANSFLREIAGGRITIESAFEYRDDGGIRIALPQIPKKMSLKRAAAMLQAQADAEEAMHEFTKDFDCRPMDGAFAFNKVLKDVYGMTAIGREMGGFFTQLPELRTVRISPTEEVQVPFGLLSFLPLGAEFYLQERQDEDYGMGFQVYVHAKKKYEVEIRGLLMLVEAFVKENSIYHNKALVGVGRVVGNQYKEPEFLNPYKVDRTKIVYSSVVQEALEDEIWGVIKNAELLREPYTFKVRLTPEETTSVSGEPIKKVEVSLAGVSGSEKSYEVYHDNEGAYYEVTSPGEEIGNKVLLHGEPGTGKTVGALVTAQHCLENDWTFVQARWDEDINHVMRFCELLGKPAVLVIEDVEKLVQKDPRKMDSLLEMFDGLRTKGREVILLMTSNHAGELPKALTRAGRINRMVYVSDLDGPAVEQLINVLVPQHQREELDYTALHAAYEGFAPSWIVQALKGVVRRSVIRTGKRGQPLATPDFVRCADALRPAWKLHTDTEDSKKEKRIEDLLYEMVSDAVKFELQQHRVAFESEGQILIRN